MTAGRSGLFRATLILVGLATLAFVVVAGPALLSRAGRLLPQSTTLGDILIDTPEVYTRERLVNDRFQQEAWLRSQLDRTAELIDSDRFASTEGRLARVDATAIETGAHITPGGADAAPDKDQAGALTQRGAMDLKPNPIDEFRDAQAYRDVIRAELMRTQLDDRHDIEGNTLYRLDFDATVSPGDNTTDLAVVTVAIQEAKDEDGSMYGGLYDDFHKEFQAEITDAVKQQADALMFSSEGLRGTDRLALEEYLHDQICQQLEGISRAIGPKPNQGENSNAIDLGKVPHNQCFDLIEAGVAEYINKHLMLRRQDFDFQYSDMLRNLLSAGVANEFVLPDPLAALRDIDLAPPSDGSTATLRDRLRAIRQTLDDAVKYARFQCSSVRPTTSKQFTVGESGTGKSDGVALDCPPDLNPNEPTGATMGATMGMLQRLQTIVADLKRSAASDSEQQPLTGGELADALRQLVGSGWSPEAVSDRLSEMIGPYGDPLLNVLCPHEGWRASPVCSDNPIKSAICSGELEDSQTCEGALHAELLARFDPGVMPLGRIDLERLVAEFILAKLNNDLSAYEFAVPLKDLFPHNYIDCSLGACTVVLEPSRGANPGDPTPIDVLREKLNKNARAFSYAVMPTEWAQALATEELTRTSLLAALRTAAASGGKNLEAALQGLNEFEERVETRYRNPIVFGFGTEPAAAEGNGSSSWLDGFLSTAAQESSAAPEVGSDDTRTHFGWIIRPRLAHQPDGGGRSFRQVPGFYPLSAVVSVPSWWRRLKIEVHTEWVDPNGWWGAPQSIAADLLAARGDDCTRPTCDIHILRVPGSVNEIRQKLNYEVRKEPYIDFKTTAPEQFLEIGRSGQVVLEGGRLWRSTVVRMGHQQADKILVLPDMKGIIAEFSCVQPVPGEKGILEEATAQTPSDQQSLDAAAPNELTALVHVWTSEGRTADPLRVFLRPFVAREIGEEASAEYLKPCFLDGDKQTG